MGAAEAMTVPLVAHRDLERFGLESDGHVEATNALRAEEPVLRPVILPGLLKAAALNVGHGLADLALFELGHVFRAPHDGEVLPDERDHLAVLLTGSMLRAPVEPDRAVDVYDAVDIVHAVAVALELADVRLVNEPAPGFDAARVAAIVVDSRPIGHVGALAPAVAEAFGVPAGAVALELDIDGLLAGTRRDRAFRAPSRFPVSTIDLAFALPEEVTAAEVEATLRAAVGDVLEDVRVFDEFRSESLGARRSLAFALRFRAPDRTLTDAEIAELRQRAIDAVTRAHDAALRA
jgi:phenylalanyl-tRNA synthetase beta chain